MLDRSLSKRPRDLLLMNYWFINQFIIREFAAYLRTAKQMSSCQLIHAYLFVETVVVLNFHSRLIAVSENSGSLFEGNRLRQQN